MLSMKFLKSISLIIKNKTAISLFFIATMAPSSSGLGRRVLSPVTRVQIPLGSLLVSGIRSGNTGSSGDKHRTPMANPVGVTKEGDKSVIC